MYGDYKITDAAPPTQASDSVRLQALEAENAELKAALDQARAAVCAAEVERGVANSELFMCNDSINTQKILTLVACHSNTEFKWYTTLLNLKYYLKFSVEVVIIESLEFEGILEHKIRDIYPNDIYRIKVIYTKNNNYICQGKWMFYLNEYYNTIQNYSQICLTNDSFEIVNDFVSMINQVSIHEEMYSMCISNEIFRHYTDFFRIYNKAGLFKIMHYYRRKMDEFQNPSFKQMIDEFEMKSHKIFDKIGGFYEEPDPVNIHFIEPYHRNYLKRGYPIKKIKKMQINIYPGWFAIPKDFDAVVYKSMNPDLEQMNDTEARNHFITHGIREGRPYTQIDLQRYLDKFDAVVFKSMMRKRRDMWSSGRRTFGFIVLRHVNNELTNKYWIKCVNSIRKYYPENNILIIDDNSDYNFITNETLYKTTIINSEYPKRGELLPYYYYLHNKLFDIAMIIHDSVFINSYIDMNVEKYKILWDFEHRWDQIVDETKMINIFNDLELNKFYEDKYLWKGCFGGMSIITHDYLTYINKKYDIRKLLDLVLCRFNRCSFERVIGCLLQKEGLQESLLGNIHNYCKWGISFEEIDRFNHLPLIKCWTGR